MSEGLLGNLPYKIATTKENTLRAFKAIEWRMSPEARGARDELFAIRNAIGPMVNDNDTFPGILRLSVGAKEYISIRRIEGKRLLTVNDNTEKMYDRETIFELNPDLIPDGGIVILITADSAKPLNEDIINKYPYNGWEFAIAMGDGIPYDPKDWKIMFSNASFIKRIGSRFYKLPKAGISSAETNDIFNKQHLVQKLGLNKQRKLEIDKESDNFLVYVNYET